MLVSIDKIIVGDRIRKDFGDLEELAEDIKQNGLLNALVVTPSGTGNGTYVLIAGERRLRAMRDILGYTAVPVNSVGAEDAEQALLMEISENECRKDFTKTERLEYARRLAAIEAARAKERQGTRTDLVADLPQSQDSGKTRDKVAAQLGTSATQLRQEQFIADNADLLDPADFADWDEGRLSTNKAFQRIKAAQRQAEQERDDARETVSMAQQLSNELKRQRDEARKEASAAEWDAAELRRKLTNLRDKVEELEQQASEPQIVEREVVPADYGSVKHERDLYLSDLQKLRKSNEDMRHELDRAKVLLGEKERTDSANWDIAALTTATNNYLRQYGGKAWAFDQFYRVDATTQAEFTKAINNLAAFAQNLAQMIREQSNE